VDKIVWLASYPKSGNTWMRTLLTNYLRDADAPADINHLDGGPIASARVWFDEWVGVEASALDDATIARLRPAVYRCLLREAQQTLFMKAHDAWRSTDSGESLFPSDVTAGVVYLLRNPLDVAVSAAHHYGISLQESVERLCDPEFALGRSLGSTSDQLRQQLGAWSGHVRSWVDESGLPIVVIRYEDLRADTENLFAEIVRFCGLPYNPDRVRKAVAFSDFRELQRQEREAGFRERPALASAPFFRQGAAGAGRQTLTQAQVQLILETHGETMQRFGYDVRG
jgi:aryl sulfotransferase